MSDSFSRNTRRMDFQTSTPERASRDEQSRETERIRNLIEHIHAQAERLRQAAGNLPTELGESLEGKAEELLEKADELRDEVRGLSAP